ncbi:MAG: helix-turn-helix domain-containing protein [Candidatus Aminicenantes bacterium]
MKKINMDTGKYLTVSQLAEILGVSRIAVHKRIKNGDIKAEKIGKMYAIPKSYVSEILGQTLSESRKKIIKKAVHKAVKEYGEVLIKLGNE